MLLHQFGRKVGRDSPCTSPIPVTWSAQAIDPLVGPPLRSLSAGSGPNTQASQDDVPGGIHRAVRVLADTHVFFWIICQLLSQNSLRPILQIPPRFQTGMSPIVSTRLDYLRHGEPVGGSRFRGNGVDDPLSERGWQQMRASTAAIDGWQRVVSFTDAPPRRVSAMLAGDRSRTCRWRSSPTCARSDSVPGKARNGNNCANTGAAEYDALPRPGAQTVPPVPDRWHCSGRGWQCSHPVRNYPGEHLLVVCHAGVIRGTFGQPSRSRHRSTGTVPKSTTVAIRASYDRRSAPINWRLL